MFDSTVLTEEAIKEVSASRSYPLTRDADYRAPRKKSLEPVVRTGSSPVPACLKVSESEASGARCCVLVDP